MTENKLKNMTFGALSGLIVGVTLQPLDIIKSNLIINPKNIVEI